MERSKKPAEMNPKVMAVHLFFLVLFFVLVILGKQPLWLALPSSPALRAFSQ